MRSVIVAISKGRWADEPPKVNPLGGSLATRPAETPTAPGEPPDVGLLPWIGPVWSRSARLAKKDKPLQNEPGVIARENRKSPLRRCFKSRFPSRLGIAGFASGY
jgi:hypothetical protein